MLLMDELEKEFYEYIDGFENEKISYDEFMDFVTNCNQNQVESVGEDIWLEWMGTRRNYHWMKQFEQNEGQLSLF